MSQGAESTLKHPTSPTQSCLYTSQSSRWHGLALLVHATFAALWRNTHQCCRVSNSAYGQRWLRGAAYSYPNRFRLAARHRTKGIDIDRCG